MVSLGILQLRISFSGIEIWPGQLPYRLGGAPVVEIRVVLDDRDVEEQPTGSSSSHGMCVPALEATGQYYEDYFPQEGDLDSWPLVGTWLKTHFLVQMCSVAGDFILWD